MIKLHFFIKALKYTLAVLGAGGLFVLSSQLSCSKPYFFFHSSKWLVLIMFLNRTTVSFPL